MQNAMNTKRGGNHAAASGSRPQPSAPGADEASSQASEPDEVAGGALLSDEYAFNLPSNPQSPLFNNSPAGSLYSPAGSTRVGSDSSTNSDAIPSMPQTPRLTPRVASTPSGDSSLSRDLETPSPMSLSEIGPSHGRPRGLPVRPQRASDVGNAANFDLASTNLTTPPPAVISGPRRNNDGLQIRPAPVNRGPLQGGPPQAEIPPLYTGVPRGLPLQIGRPLQFGIVPYTLPPVNLPPGRSARMASFPTPPPFDPAQHPGFPQGPLVVPQVPQPHQIQMAQATATHLQRAPHASNSAASMPSGPGPLGRPEQFPSLQAGSHHRFSHGQGQLPWNLPGYELAAPAHNGRPQNGRPSGGDVTEGQFILVHVGGRPFRIPMELMDICPFWASLTFVEPPAQGWSLPGVDPDIFSVLIECVYSTSGLDGTEPGLNLVKICYAITLAFKWGMSQELEKLQFTAYRYVVRKILRNNPTLPRQRGALDYSHYVYRSEEIYRTWELTRDHEIVESLFSENDMAALYTCAIPEGFWRSLTANFQREFLVLIDVYLSVRTVSPKMSFQSWWMYFFHMAGFPDARWLDRDASARIFGLIAVDERGYPLLVTDRAEFAATRARANAVANALELMQPEEVHHYFSGATAPANVNHNMVPNNTLSSTPPRRHTRRGLHVRFSPLPDN